ncbi:MAG: LapA family protein, partial [Zoogloeaceae bacterium]|nr:LapA family protein [Zoogloeaceae bacterium]
MRAFSWFLRLFLFGFLLAFALLNVEPVSLRFFFDQTWQMPLIALLLGFFAAGMLFGAMAMIGPLVRARREAARLRKAAKTNEKQKQ